MIRDTAQQDEVIQTGTKLNPKLVSLVLVALLLAAAVLLPGYQSWFSAEQSVQRDRVRIATVQLGNLDRDISAQGTVVAAIKPTVFSPNAGVVTLLVEAGDAVMVDQPLARIESPNLRNLLSQEQAVLAGAEHNLQRQEIQSRKTALENQQKVDLAEVALTAARRELRRAEAARSKDAISEFDYDKARDDVATAELRFKHASQDAGLQTESLAFELKTMRLEVDRQRLKMRELERQVAELIISSPVTGVVGNLLVENKDAINANEPLLTVVDLSAFEVELKVPDSFASNLQAGQAVEVSHLGKPWPARLRSVSPEIENSQVSARVAFPDAVPPNLRQNQRVTARILLEAVQDTLVVERGPFMASSAGRYAYVVVDNLATKRPITTGAQSISQVQITSGLQAGDQIVISNLTDFREADTVYLVD